MVSGKGARQKGLSYERSISNKLKHIYPEAKRHLEDRIDQCQGFDIDGTGKYRIQCKRYKKYVPITKIFEVQPEDGTIPILITKGDHQPDMAVVPLTHFIKLLEIENDSKKESNEKIRS